MGLNKMTKSNNMYNFINATWNPLGGKCIHNCSYCSSNKLRKRYHVLNQKYSGPTRFFEKELTTNLGKNNTIFVCAQQDLFAKRVNHEWIVRILEYCKSFDTNTYLFQTKNPENFTNYGVWLADLSNIILATTLETNRWYPNQMVNAPSPMKRAFAMSILPVDEKMITIEPIMDLDVEELVFMIDQCNPETIIIGADSGKNNLPEPSTKKVKQLIEELKLDDDYNVVLKKNLKRLL